MRPFLEEIAPEDAEALRAVAARRRFPRGTTLFSEGETSDRAFVVVAGHLKISFLTPHGDEVILGIRGPGDIVGELTVLDGSPRSATAAALDDVDTLVIPAGTLLELMRQRPSVALSLTKMLAARLRDADRKRVEFSALSVPGRVAARLLELVEGFGEQTDGGVRSALPITQQDLAAWSGASREAVTKALQEFRERGWIETHRRAVTVVDPVALAKRAR